MNHTHSRRLFLSRTLALTGGAVLSGIPSFGIDDLYPPVFDMHCHPGPFFVKGLEGYSVDAGIAKTLGEMKTGKMAGAFVSLVADAQIIKIGPEGVKPYRNFEPNEAWKDYQRQVSAAKEMLRDKADFVIAAKGTDFKKNSGESKISVYLACEGGDFLEGDAGKLELMVQDGIRSLQLVHYHPNAIGDLQTEPPEHNGLSTVGKEIVKRMNTLRMVVDVAHASFETTKAIAAASSQPIILSHSMLTNDSTHPLVRRTISIEHAKVVASTGGVIGAWPSGLNKSFDDFVDNTKRLIDAVGIDHVGIGTDMDGNYKPVLSSYTQMPLWVAGLQKVGLSASEVAKVAGGNMQRVLEAVLG